MSTGITGSRADPSLLYVSESQTGGIAVIDRVRGIRAGIVQMPSGEEGEFGFALAALAGDRKIYQTRLKGGGILVVAPSTGALKVIPVGGPVGPGRGRSDAVVLAPDERHLYAAVLDGEPRGVAEIATESDSVVRFLTTPNDVPQEIALSPTGKRLFVTTQDRWEHAPSENLLIDTKGLQVLARLPRPRPQGRLRHDGGVAFAPSGKLIFVAHDTDVDVYLNREEFR
jgi:DNA-binding beta-propeller fold protein YncE